MFNAKRTNKKSKIAKVRLTIKRVRYLPDAYLYIVSLTLIFFKISYLMLNYTCYLSGNVDEYGKISLLFTCFFNTEDMGQIELHRVIFLNRVCS